MFVLTPLLRAIDAKDYQLTLTLLETEDPCVYGKVQIGEDYFDLIPIFWAIREFSGEERLEVVKRCLKKRASCRDNGYKIYDCHNAIQLAIRCGDIDIIKLFNCKLEAEYIEYACKHNVNADIVKYLSDSI